MKDENWNKWVSNFHNATLLILHDEQLDECAEINRIATLRQLQLDLKINYCLVCGKPNNDDCSCCECGMPFELHSLRALLNFIWKDELRIVQK